MNSKIFLIFICVNYIAQAYIPVPDDSFGEYLNLNAGLLATGGATVANFFFGLEQYGKVCAIEELTMRRFLEDQLKCVKLIQETKLLTLAPTVTPDDFYKQLIGVFDSKCDKRTYNNVIVAKIQRAQQNYGNKLSKEEKQREGSYALPDNFHDMAYVDLKKLYDAWRLPSGKNKNVDAHMMLAKEFVVFINQPYFNVLEKQKKECEVNTNWSVRNLRYSFFAFCGLGVIKLGMWWYGEPAENDELVMD